MRINRTLGAGRVLVALFLLSFLAASAQQPVSLDSCRRMALKNNKQLRIAEEKVKGAGYTKKSARGAYFPGIDFSGTYMYNQKSISLLEEDQYLPTKSFDLATQEYKYNVVTNPMTGEPILNNGQPIPQTVALIPKEAFEFDVHNVYVGLVTLTQPIFMGGKIKALNDIASYAEKLAVTQRNTAEKEIVYQTDEAYWQVVSLVHKKRLAESYTALLDTLNRHVQDMIEEGVATQSDGLTVAVRLNAAQITLAKVDNGLALSRMALAQICGLPVNSVFTLEDESLERVEPQEQPLAYDMDEVFRNRNEVLSLDYAAKIYEKKKNLALSDMLPKLALVGTYSFSNPNAFNGFKNEFNGMFSVGVMLNIPILHWGQNYNKIRAAKSEAVVAKLQLADTKEKIELQVNQAAFKASEAYRTYRMAVKNLEKADENLRNAQVGFEEGVRTTTNVLEAQTAWLEAQSEKIDAEIDTRLCEVYLAKALGTMRY